jgi:hypothetical protein
MKISLVNYAPHTHSALWQQNQYFFAPTTWKGKLTVWWIMWYIKRNKRHSLYQSLWPLKVSDKMCKRPNRVHPRDIFLFPPDMAVIAFRKNINN